MADRIVQQPVAGARQAQFSELPTAETERSTFDMSHSWKGTHQTNNIIPMFLQEVLPGDTFSVNTTVFSRLATPLKPIMDSLTMDIHFFFVPNRLVWDNWQKFMGEREQVDDDPTELSIPQAYMPLNVDLYSGCLFDYFGIPLAEPGDTDDVYVNALPIRAYWRIVDDWYKNQNIVSDQTKLTGDGPDDVTIFTYSFPFQRHKFADYFSRALPWPQKGDPVFLPLGTTAPVVGAGTEQPTFLIDNQTSTLGISAGGDQQSVDWTESVSGTPDVAEWVNPALEADLTTATAATINDIRTAFQIQKLLERDARGGTRYIEIILSHFNVQSPDFRLQRAEFLGGGSNRIIVSPVAATVATEDAPQANLAAVGTGLVKGGFTHAFVEHGYIMGLMSCRADLTYQQGLDRHWSRKTRYDYYWPSLSHLGEQAIYNKEIYFQNDGGTSDDQVFGYQERYAEYRYSPSKITGKFRSVDPESLDVWHLSQDFDNQPNLNFQFIIDNPPIDRVVAVPSEPDLITDIWHEVKATRPMPVYAVPGLVDHF